MKNNINQILIAIFCLVGLVTNAQESKKDTLGLKKFINTNIDYQAKVQLSLGGASPLGIPAQIRDIESFKPANVLGLEVNATKWLSDEQKYGIRVGLKIEGRGMKTEATVKNYFTQIEDDSGARTTGYFTGKVVTEAKNTYLTIPVLFVWNASERWNIYGGFYFSLAVNKSFNGHIYDGVFREGTPIGEPATFEGDAIGIYDFSNDISTFQFGEQIGIEYKFKQNFSISLDATFANTQVFKKDFDAISFKMYNIFGNLGFGYRF